MGHNSLDLISKEEADSLLYQKALAGLKAKGLAHREEYISRLESELEMIKSLGFSPYFLIVEDFIRWARSQGILPGPGRGSGAGSLCVYTLGITQVDPIKHGLFLERFLNPHRVAPPDLDLDFEETRRDEVIQYVIRQYGREHVAKIGTYGTMKSRGAIRDAARALGVDFATASSLAELTLPPVLGKPPTLKECYKKVPELRRIRESSSDQSRVLQVAERIEGKTKSFGSHASGIIISTAQPLTDLIPLALDKDGELVTQFDMHDLEDLGFLKFDFLGLTTLSVISKCLSILKRSKGIHLVPEEIPEDDPLTYKTLQAGNVTGVFQLETSAGIRDLVVQIKPTCLDDLSTLVAIYRPGPLGSSHLQKFLKVRASLEEPEYLIPELEPILRSTAGWQIFQEQSLEIAKKIAGFTAAEADLLRRAIGKKKPEEMAALKERFILGCIGNGVSQEKALELFSEVEYAQGYSFNRAHSVSYSLITYWTAYLKAHFPTEYMCAALECNKGNEDQTILYLAECRRAGIQVLPPDINTSRQSFSVDENGNIRFGLAAIKNLGESPVEHILAARTEGPFRSLLDFSERTDLSIINRTKLESLALSGAMSSFGATRSSLLGGIDSLLAYRDAIKRHRAKAATYESRIQKAQARLDEIRAQEISLGRSHLKPLANPKKPEDPSPPQLPMLPELPRGDILAKERELLGFFLSGHPLDDIVLPPGTITISQAKCLNSGEVKILALVASHREITTKTSKQKMSFLQLEDQQDRIEGVLFPSVYKKNSALLEGSSPMLISGLLESTVGPSGDRVVKIACSKLEKVVAPQVTELMELYIPLSQEGTTEAMALRRDLASNSRLLLHLLPRRGGEFIGEALPCRTIPQGLLKYSKRPSEDGSS